MNVISSLALLAILSAPGDFTLVQFTSQQCQYCQAMQPIVAQLAQQGVRVETVDADRQRPVAAQYRVAGVPTFVAVSGGREVGRIEGVTTIEKLAALAQAAATGPQGLEVANRNSIPSSPQSPAASPLVAEQSARAATVRIKVEDATGYGFGTGTIIDTHENEALVITCGHLFRESKGKGKITADVFAGGAAQTVDGQLIGYDLDRDVALISVRAAGTRAVTVAPPAYVVRPGDQAFTFGCDKGADPSVRATRITAVNKYKGRPNYTAAGQPVDGRSGGGLFTAEGFLIGICNAADPADDEGLYAGLASIHWQLDKIGQSDIYQRAAQVAAAAQPNRDVNVAGAAQVAVGTGLSAPQIPPTMPGSGLGGVGVREVAATGPIAARGDLVPVAAAGDDTEIVFIVRSKRDPSQRSDVYVVDQAAPDLIARITHAARASGEQRAALARTGQAGLRTASAAGGQPVVRGQSGEY